MKDLKFSGYKTWNQIFVRNYKRFIEDLSPGILKKIVKNHSKMITIQKLKGKVIGREYSDGENLSSAMLKVEIKELNKRTKRKGL